MEKENERAALMKKLNPYKTDLRREVISRRQELTRIHRLKREKTQDKRLSRPASRGVVTIDTNKAKSNIPVVRLALRDLGWKEFPFQRKDHNCDITWHAVSFHDQSEIYSGQVNKFPGSLEIFRKVNTFRWLEFMKSLFPEEYSFFPRTWLLPHQFNEFANTVKSITEKTPKEKPMYIVKPSEGSQGDGIYLLQDPHNYINFSATKTHVVQEYLSNVFLIDRYKFDLRVYVVLKCLEPLEFYICREGLARFSTVEYEQPSYRNMHETFMHLTNYSLNKKSCDFKISDKDDEGSKRKMSAVFRQMQNLGYDMGVVWRKIEHLVTKTLIAVVGELKVEYQAAIPTGKPGPTCFQVLGFDIILMKDLQPMLLEVNSNPSLSITEEHETPTGGVEYLVSVKDEEVKRTLIRDTLILIAPKHKYTRRRRMRRQRRKVESDDEEQDTKADKNANNNSSAHKQKRNHQRERHISIKFVEGENTESQKSMFHKVEYYGSTRKERNRLLAESKGEIFYKEQEKTDSKLEGNSSNEASSSNFSGLKRWIIRKTGRNKIKIITNNKDRSSVVLPPIVDKSKSILTEEEEDANTMETDPILLELADNGDDEEGDSDVDEDGDEEEESCLKEIFPAVYGNSFKSERVVEKLADIFITCLGVKGCLRLGPGMFRLFARKCHLNRKGITNAAIDILYIDIQRKWEYMNPDGALGLNFFAFVYGCCKIASESFNGNSLKTQIENFIDHCENFLKIPSDLEIEAAKRAIRYGRGFSKGGDRNSLTLPPAEERSKTWLPKDWPAILDEAAEERFFNSPYKRHRNIFHMLQSIKK